MAEKKPVDLSFPVKGYDEGWAYKAQPEGTSPDCLNVRPYDVLSQRLRGGQREGLSKWTAAALNGVNPIQRMGVVVKAQVGGFIVTPTAMTYGFVQGNGPLSATDWYCSVYDGGWGLSAAAPIVDTNKIAMTPLAADQVVAAIYKAPLTDSSLISQEVTVTVPSVSYVEVQIIFQKNNASSFTGIVDVDYHAVIVRLGSIAISIWVGDAFPVTSLYTPGSGDYKDPAWWLTPRTLSVTIVGTTISFYADATLLGTNTPANDLSANTYAGFFVSGAGPGNGGYATIDNWYVAGTAGSNGGGSGGGITSLLSNRKPAFVAVSGGNVYSGDKTAMNLSTGGAAALVSKMEKVHMTDCLGRMYLVDGTNYKILDTTTNTVSAWTPTAGTLPIVASDTCRLIASYRGRIVLSGLYTDPQNWFMSKVGDPLDWNYGATVSAVMAVAGNNCIAGKCPDIVTCLAPMNDDLMVIGGDHTLWLMRGDPADGGRIDNISQQMGILGPDSYCFGPDNTFYFFGNGVLWRMPLGGTPEPLSRGRLDKTFGAIDYLNFTVKLLWDETFHGVHIYVVPIAQGSTTHYWWDARTDGFWVDQYPVAHGPTSVLIFDADVPNDRTVLLGGWDSYIRQTDRVAKTDDGTTILSRVKFGPMTPGGIHQNARLSRVITVLESSSDPVSLRIYAAQSPEEVVAATVPAWSYIASAINRYSIPRISGNSLLFELKNDSFSTAWVTGTVYAVGAQVVAVDGNPYVCITAHTSTTGGTNPTPPGNATDWVLSAFRTWAVEGISGIMEVTGRTRHGRL